VSSPFLLGEKIDHHFECYNNEFAMKLKRDINMDYFVTYILNPKEFSTMPS
jgi:hypothetical protein